LSKHVQGFLEVVFINLKVVVCVSSTCPGIVAASMLLDEFAVDFLVRVFIGAHEEHVFKIVGKSLAFPGIFY
jgi:hypothetical protein